MRKWLLTVLLALSGSPAWATFTLVQHVYGACTNTSQTCNVTVTSTGSGHVILIGMGIALNDVISSVSGAGSYTVPAGCQAADSTTSGTSCAYNLSSTSGVTTITVTRGTTTTGAWKCEVIELSFTGPSASLDTTGSRDQSTNTTTPAGPALTLTGSNDIIFQTIQSSTSQTFSSISGGYTEETCGTGNRMCFAWLLNTTTGAAATWTVVTSAHAALGAIAISEASGSSAAPTQPWVIMP